MNHTTNHIKPNTTVNVCFGDYQTVPNPFTGIGTLTNVVPVITTAMFVSPRGQWGQYAEIVLNDDALHMKAGQTHWVDACQIMQ